MTDLVLEANNAQGFELMYKTLCTFWLQGKTFDRGEVHAQKTTSPEMITREVLNVSLNIKVPDFEYDDEIEAWQIWTQCNLPWAEDHFQERVSGQPLNPPPSEAYWPFAQAGNAAHKKNEKFSHTYPERFWPKQAAREGRFALYAYNYGIRFDLGDLEDLLQVLKKNPRSRQAYLPVWFPEDLTAAKHNERVPCTLGYHFLQTPEGGLDVSYYMRSCDLIRFFADDCYMAGRLLQWVAARVGLEPGRLRMYIANLHAFVGDETFVRSLLGSTPQPTDGIDVRSSYNWDALS